MLFDSLMLAIRNLNWTQLIHPYYRLRIRERTAIDANCARRGRLFPGSALPSRICGTVARLPAGTFPQARDPRRVTHAFETGSKQT
jgi:hypothetical protein